MRYQNLAQITQAGGWLLGLEVLSGCVTTPSSDALPSFPCPAASMNAPVSISQDQATNNNQNRATMPQALQKRLQERERTIAGQTQQIEFLSSQLKALKQIDQETRRQPRKGFISPIP